MKKQRNYSIKKGKKNPLAEQIMTQRSLIYHPQNSKRWQKKMLTELRNIINIKTDHFNKELENKKMIQT